MLPTGPSPRSAAVEVLKVRLERSKMGDVGDRPTECRLEEVLEGVKLEGDGWRERGEAEDWWRGRGEDRSLSEAAVLQEMLGMEKDWAEKPI